MKSDSTLPGEVVSSQSVFGAPCWVSLTTRDLAAAERFYQAVLGWEWHASKLDDGYRIAVVDGVPVAGISAVTSLWRTAVAWIPYFAVSSADETVARSHERGGTTAVGPISFPPGRAALLADRDGAVFGIWEGELVVGLGDLAPRGAGLHTAAHPRRLRRRDLLRRGPGLGVLGLRSLRSPLRGERGRTAQPGRRRRPDLLGRGGIRTRSRTQAALADPLRRPRRGSLRPGRANPWRHRQSGGPRLDGGDPQRSRRSAFHGDVEGRRVADRVRRKSPRPRRDGTGGSGSNRG